MRNLACHPANAVILSTGFACHAQTSEFRLNLQGRAKKVPVKFCEESSVWADGLSIGCLGQWAAARRGNSNMQVFFCTTL